MAPVRIDRRTFVRRSLALGAASCLVPSVRTAGFGRAPALVVQESSRPAIPQGVAAGDVTGGRAVIWSRADRAARMFVEYDTSDRFARPQRVEGPAALDTSDFTARVALTDLPPGQRIFYRVLFQDLADIRRWSLPAVGSFRTPGDASRDVTIAWSADTVGQGWGINPDWGGLRLYETMRAAQPDVFINAGDTIYADQPLAAEVALDDGTVWKNIVTPAKSHAAETIDDFRGNHQYNLLDDHMRRFNADVPQVVMWDDHEVLDNWYLGTQPGSRRAVPREVHGAPRGAGAAGVCRVQPAAAQSRQSGPRLPQPDLRSARGDFRAGYAQLSGAELGEPPEGARRVVGALRRRPARMAEAQPGREPGHVEGDRQRPADRPGRPGRAVVLRGVRQR